MKPIHSFIVTAKLPKKIAKLKELAYNYWWCWNSEAKELFLRMDRNIWRDVDHNPVLLLNRLPKKELDRLAQQQDFLGFLDYVHGRYEDYMKSNKWYDNVKNAPDGTLAYFSMEFGINESLPNYSGGLGVLSGDHLKSASDLGLNLVGIGLLYQQGYFRQHLTQHGWQNELYHINDFFTMPCTVVKNDAGEPIILNVDLPLGKAFFQIWRIQIGTVPLFLLDTNIEENQIPGYRDITDQLYGGDRETRIRQEIVLGIGGMRALEAMNIPPSAIHINEGHAAFALLERSRMLMSKHGLDFWTAKQMTKASSIFTTHTPVPAGNEVFKRDRIETYLGGYYRSFGLDEREFFGLGRQDENNPNEDFSMTVLGLRLSAGRNGVSKLHGEVARNMWRGIWKCYPIDEIPIGHITNGIHTQTWVARELADLYDRYLSPVWRSETDNQSIWDKIDTIPSEEIWREKQRRRVRLVLFARDYLKRRSKSFLPPDQISKIDKYLNPDALTIGFARRFATYKRAMLLFTDIERLKAILMSKDRPVQILIAGKAHPHDNSGKEVIQAIIRKVRDNGLERHVVFLEDYDMVISRFLVKGCDVWLNTPIRPMEASGTSGMKAALNGGLNLSVLDGWWDEAYNGDNGFSIGYGEEYTNLEEQDIIESGALYDILEQHVVPAFYDRAQTNRVPEKWLAMVKNCVKTIAGQFSTMRMVKEYANKYYFAALHRFKEMSENNASGAKELVGWLEKVRENWKSVDIIDVSINKDNEAYIEKPVKVSVTVNLGSLTPKDVVVEAYYGAMDPHGDLYDAKTKELEVIKSDGSNHLYEGSYKCEDTGKQGVTARIIPRHPLLSPAESYLCTWA